MASVSPSFNFIQVTKANCFEKFPFPLTEGQAATVETVEESGSCSLWFNPILPGFTLKSQDKQVVHLKASASNVNLARIQACVIGALKESLVHQLPVRDSQGEILMDHYLLTRESVPSSLDNFINRKLRDISPEVIQIRAAEEREKTIQDLMASLPLVPKAAISKKRIEIMQQEKGAFLFRQSESNKDWVVLELHGEPHEEPSAKNVVPTRQWRIAIDVDHFRIENKSHVIKVPFLRGNSFIFKQVLLGFIEKYRADLCGGQLPAYTPPAKYPHLYKLLTEGKVFLPLNMQTLPTHHIYSLQLNSAISIDGLNKSAKVCIPLSPDKFKEEIQKQSVSNLDCSKDLVKNVLGKDAFEELQQHEIVYGEFIRPEEYL